MTDYRTHCAWCHRELDGSYITFLPAFDYQYDHPVEADELAVRYCSAACVTARRRELFHRRKAPREKKWTRWTAEVPPELAAMLEAAAKHSLGVNRASYSRANVVRAALGMYLDAHAPIAEAPVDATASDVIDLPALSP